MVRWMFSLMVFIDVFHCFFLSWAFFYQHYIDLAAEMGDGSDHLRFLAWDKWLATGSTILWAKPQECLSFFNLFHPEVLRESMNWSCFWCYICWDGGQRVKDGGKSLVGWWWLVKWLVKWPWLLKHVETCWNQGWREGTASHPAAALGWKLQFLLNCHRDPWNDTDRWNPKSSSKGNLPGWNKEPHGWFFRFWSVEQCWTHG